VLINPKKLAGAWHSGCEAVIRSERVVIGSQLCRV